MEANGCKLLIDPFLSGNPTASADAAQIAADYILVSHGHRHHLCDTIEIACRPGPTLIANYEICEWLQRQGLKKVHGQQHGGAHIFPFGCVKMTLAFHGSALPDGSYGGNPCGFLIKFENGKTIYDAADT